MENDAAIPGFTANPSLQAKLDGLDDSLQPIEKELVEDEKKEDIPAEDSNKEDESTEQDQEDNKEDESTDGAEDEGKDDSESTEESEEDAGYTIDGDEADDESSVEETEEVPTNSTQETNPNLNAEQKYILDNLKTITVRGTVADGELKEYKIYSPEQLPAGFKYEDERALSIANKQYNMIEQEATRLQGDYRNQQTTKATKAFTDAERTADTQEIGKLQRSGDIPMFKAQQNDPKFEEDPGVMLVQDVLDFKDTKNKEFYDASQAGRPYKHIGFEEAFALYKRANPDATNPEQDKEDKERVEQAKRTKNTKGQPASDNKKVTVKSGISSRDLDALLEERTRDW